MSSSSRVAALALALVAVACADDERAPAARRPTPSPTLSSAAPACPNQEAVARDDGLRSGGALTGDVTGDGSQDRVSIRVDPEGGPGCKAFLVVESDPSVTTAALTERGGEGGLTDPSLHSLAEINGAGGLDVVINEASGASTQFVGVFTLVEDGLERVTIGGGEAEPWAGATRGLFPFGGSVGHIEAVDCARGGIAVTSGVPAAGRRAMERGIYAVTRHVLEVDGATLEDVDVVRAKVPIDELGESFPEFATSPFGSC